MQPAVKCLLVDDLEENLLALSALLKQDGVELLTATSGAQALELLLVHDDVALALLDVQMPDMDGFELAELMRGNKRSRNVPLIFITAGVRDQSRQFKGYENGAVDFLYKPVEPHVLRSKVDVFFSLHRQKQQLAQQLAQQLEERTQTLRLNEMFTAVLGHDLRGPLSAIMLSAQLMQARAESEVMRKAAARMINSGKWMSRMIEDMLDTARARLGGGIPVKPQLLALDALVERVVQEQLAAHPQRQIDLTVNGEMTGEWDADRLQQVAGNLIGNALQHGDAAAPVRVELDGSATECVALSVGNAGEILAETLPHIFDPFRSGRYQEPDRAGGLGLGLYIVAQLVEAHQGRITVDSRGGRTTFRVTLPRRVKAGVGQAPTGR